MSFYDEMQQIATNVLGEFNQGVIKLIQLKTPENGTPDDPGELTEVVTELKGVVSGITFKYLKEGYNAVTDFEATVAVVQGVQPLEGDFLEVDGVQYKIIKDVSVPAAGVNVVWKFIVRKGG